MAKSGRGRKLAIARVLLRDLEDLVEGEKWTLDAARLAEWRREPWAGADVVICSAPQDDPSSGDTFVVTPFAAELSWLFDRLGNAFRDFVDFGNKFAFYMRLADAANRYTASRAAAVSNPRDLCFAVIREAGRIMEEEGSGGFRSPHDVQVRGVDVHLYPNGGSPRGTGIAIYCLPHDAACDLSNATFDHRGRPFRIGEHLQRSTEEDAVIHIALYRDVSEGEMR